MEEILTQISKYLHCSNDAVVGTFYHITRIKYLPQILEEGLIANKPLRGFTKVKDRKIKDRIWLTGDIQYIIDTQLGHKEFCDNWAVLEVRGVAVSTLYSTVYNSELPTFVDHQFLSVDKIIEPEKIRVYPYTSKPKYKKENFIHSKQIRDKMQVTEEEKRFKPAGDRLLVKPDAVETKTASGIIIPDNVQERPRVGTIVAVGDTLVIPFQIGDRVMYSKYAGVELKLDNDEFLVFRDTDIIGWRHAETPTLKKID